MKNSIFIILTVISLAASTVILSAKYPALSLCFSGLSVTDYSGKGETPLSASGRVAFKGNYLFFVKIPYSTENTDSHQEDMPVQSTTKW